MSTQVVNSRRLSLARAPLWSVDLSAYLLHLHILLLLQSLCLIGSAGSVRVHREESWQRVEAAAGLGTEEGKTQGEAVLESNTSQRRAN